MLIIYMVDICFKMKTRGNHKEGNGRCSLNYTGSFVKSFVG